jgi:hypothetical protein
VFTNLFNFACRIEFSKIADNVLGGSMKELRNQVVVYFKTINRRYPDNHYGNTLLHMVCQEGYLQMLQFMVNPANKSGLDDNELEIEPRNIRNRTPLMLCFTPPSATVCLLLNIYFIILTIYVSSQFLSNFSVLWNEIWCWC